MQFYKFEGFTVDAKWSEENDNRRVMREKVRKISMKSNSFNQHQQRKAYLFVTDASEDTVTIGIIIKNFCDVLRLTSEYLKEIEIDLKDTYLEEITLNTLRNMLGCANRNDYIDDDDEVLEQFDLDKLNGRFSRSVEYGENILDDCDKKSVYEEAGRFLARDTFIPELDRIYAGCAKNKVGGHPVHYIIQTDDRETRKGMYKEMFRSKKQEIEDRVAKLTEEIEGLQPEKEPTSNEDYSVKLLELRERLKEYTGFDYSVIPESIVEAFIERIWVSKDEFRWYLRTGNKSEGEFDPDDHIKIGSFTLTIDDAKKYIYSFSTRRRVYKWVDLNVSVWI